MILTWQEHVHFSESTYCLQFAANDHVAKYQHSTPAVAKATFLSAVSTLRQGPGDEPDRKSVV